MNPYLVAIVTIGALGTRIVGNVWARRKLGSAGNATFLDESHLNVRFIEEGRELFHAPRGGSALEVARAEGANVGAEHH